MMDLLKIPIGALAPLKLRRCCFRGCHHHKRRSSGIAMQALAFGLGVDCSEKAYDFEVFWGFGSCP